MNLKPTVSPMRISLQVPFEKKDEAKRLGAKWNPNTKQWNADEITINDLLKTFDLISVFNPNASDEHNNEVLQILKRQQEHKKDGCIK